MVNPSGRAIRLGHQGFFYKTKNLKLVRMGARFTLPTLLLHLKPEEPKSLVFTTCTAMPGTEPLLDPSSTKDGCNISRSMHDLNHTHPIFRRMIDHQIRTYDKAANSGC